MKIEEKNTKPLSTLFYNMLALKSRRRVRPLIYAYIGALTPPCLPRRGRIAFRPISFCQFKRRPFHRRKDKQRHFDQSSSTFSSRRDKSAFVPSSFTSS
ncbi:hypothetical protein T06_8399 [Trichinella sp. T6]|nr:hypothetical protein T06_8399 [Trichinella sp. T6]